MGWISFSPRRDKMKGKRTSKTSSLLGIISLVLLVAMVASLVGCIKTAQTVTTTKTEVATSTETELETSTKVETATKTEVVNPVILKLTTTAGPPPSMGLTLTQSEIAKLFEERTDGRVVIDIYWSETLASGKETVNALQTGIADIAYLRTFAEPGKVPLCTASELPGISNDNWSLLWAYWDLMNQPEISAELAKYNLKPICTLLIAEQQLISKEPIRSLADLAGKKVAASGVSAEIISGLGGVPLAMSPSEQYEGLLRGTIDAICAPVDAIQAFKFYEGGKYFTQIQIAPRMHPFVINNDSWNKISAKDQQIITDLLPELHEIAYDTILVDTAGEAIKAMQDAGVEFISFSAADEAEVQKVRAAYADKWAADMEAQGLPGNKVLNDYRTFAAEYEKTSPYIKE
jgi:TRAP-type C4-dicarboxylate transport system substrate-binding protein